jgi:hypothetical protein
MTIEQQPPYNTSRKHCKKESQTFVHCGSFDHPDLHSLNNYKFFVLFCFNNSKFGNSRAFNILLERSRNYLSNGVLHAPRKFKIKVVKQKTKMRSRSVTADQGGQKNRNGKRLQFFFRNVFY